MGNDKGFSLGSLISRAGPQFDDRCQTLAIFAGGEVGLLNPQAEAWGYMLSPLRGEEDAAEDMSALRVQSGSQRLPPRQSQQLAP